MKNLLDENLRLILVRPMRAYLIATMTMAGAVFATAPTPDERNATAPMPLPKYDHIIAPYVVKARATYPAAKKRFFAGLPKGWRFEVWIRLYQNDKSGKHVAAEDCFVEVERIQE